MQYMQKYMIHTKILTTLKKNYTILSYRIHWINNQICLLKKLDLASGMYLFYTCSSTKRCDFWFSLTGVFESIEDVIVVLGRSINKVCFLTTVLGVPIYLRKLSNGCVLGANRSKSEVFVRLWLDKSRPGAEPDDK